MMDINAMPTVVNSRVVTYQKRKGLLAKKEVRLAFLLLAPTFFFLILTSFYPLTAVFMDSLTDREFASSRPISFVGVDNYRDLLSITILELPQDAGGNYANPISVLPRQPKRYQLLQTVDIFGTRYVIGATDRLFIHAVIDTVVFVIATVSLETILGLMIALIVNVNFLGSGMMRVIMLVPWAIPTVVSARMWEWMFASSRVGFFNVCFQALGIGDGSIPFLVDSDWQMPVMILIDVWKTTPFMALLLLAGLQIIPKELYEASQVDGASRFRQFTSITFPLLKPVLAVALVFRTLDAIRVFDLFQVVLGKSRYSMASFSYYQLVDNQQMGYSAASSVVIFLIISLFAILYIRLLGVRYDE